MATGGRGNKAINELSPELRAQVDALLDMGKDVAEVYDTFPAVQAAMSYESLRNYAAQRRRDRQLSIIADRQAILDAMLEAAGVDKATLSQVEQLTLATALMAMVAGGKESTQINGVHAVLNIRKDRRKEEEHELKMRIGALKEEMDRRAVEAAKGAKKSDRSKGEAYAEIAKMLDDAIMKRGAA